MSASSISDELDARLSLVLDPFEDMCAPKSQNSIPAFKVFDLSCSCLLADICCRRLYVSHTCFVGRHYFCPRQPYRHTSAAARCYNLGARRRNTSLTVQAAIKAPKSPVKRALMLRPPTSQTISDIALLQREKAQLSQQMNQASKHSLHTFLQQPCIHVSCC